MVIHNSMGKSHNFKFWNKPNTKEYIYYDYIYRKINTYQNEFVIWQVCVMTSLNC